MRAIFGDRILNYVGLYLQLKGFFPFDERRDMRIDCSKSQGSLNVFISEACGNKLSIPVVILNSFFNYRNVLPFHNCFIK